METRKVKVLVDDIELSPLGVFISRNKNGRKEVEVEVVRETPTKIWIKLPDGNIIHRKKKRDILPV